MTQFPVDELIERAKAVRSIDEYNDLYNKTISLLMKCKSETTDWSMLYNIDCDANMILGLGGVYLGMAVVSASCNSIDFTLHRMIENVGKNNHVPVKIVRFEAMAFPQYKSVFERKISLETFEALQDYVRFLMHDAEKNNTLVVDEVKKHWESIIAGKIPFGYRLE